MANDKYSGKRISQKNPRRYDQQHQPDQQYNSNNNRIGHYYRKYLSDLDIVKSTNEIYVGRFVQSPGREPPEGLNNTTQVI